MEWFEEKKGKAIVVSLVAMIHENRAYLSEIDGAIGDGDHGINMDKGFSMAGKQLEGVEMGLSEACKVLGEVLMNDIGGSMGPLYGTFFKRMSRVTRGQESIDATILEKMIASAFEGVQGIGEAKVGDKTLLDTLYPSLEALKEARSSGKTFSEVIDAMIAGAETGWKKTKDLIAQVGRASRLGERSRGVLDAGATSCYLILKSMGETMKELAEVEGYS